jgi:pilus assembly protein CpaC
MILLVLTWFLGPMIMAVFRFKAAAVRPRLPSSRSILAVLALTAGLNGPGHAQVPPPPNPMPPAAANPFTAQPLEPAPLQAETQPPTVGSALSGESEVTPILPEIKPAKSTRPAQGPRSAVEFVKMEPTDASFDLIVNQSRILTLKQDITTGQGYPLLAVGDPTIMEFTVINPRQLRINGRGIGVTDLSITTAQNETYVYEVRVLADLDLIHRKLRTTFPDASIKLSQIRDHIVLEGEARDPAQIARIVEALQFYLLSVFAQQARTVTAGQMANIAQTLGPALRSAGPSPAGAAAAGAAAAGVAPGAGGVAPGAGGVAPGAGGVAPGTELAAPLGQGAAYGAGGSTEGLSSYGAAVELGGRSQVSPQGVPPRIINLLRVAGSQQVMLKVRIAELNRTALRRIGANFLGLDPHTGGIVGSIIAGPENFQGTIGQPGNLIKGNQLFGAAAMGPNGLNTTVFGIFQDANFEFTLGALRQNGLLKILAEPNLVALNGQLASFLAGGEFPVPVPQVGAAGIAPTITVRFREFGVRLGFVPYILDGEIIRLTVAPEVSNIDFTIAVTLVAGGTPVPGLNTRKAQTTVELREGQTLAIAGLLQLTLNGNTARIPGLGDLPILGEFFSNTSSERTEKELVVLVTPYLVEPMNHGQVPPTPGDEVKEPNDLEFYFLNRIEARTGKDFRATIAWDDPWGLRHLLHLEKKYVNGPVGFSD